MKVGVVYVATGRDGALEGAFLSAAGLKRHLSEVHVTLFTDRPQNPLCVAGTFDAVEAIDSAGHPDRIACLVRTPYERTLHLGTDSRVLSRGVGELFKFLDSCDLAMTKGQRAVVLFRKNEPVLEWLKLGGLAPDKQPPALRIATLDESWDFDGETSPRPVNIARSEEFRATTKPDLLSLAHAWVKDGRDDQAQRLYDYVGTFAPLRQLRAYWPLTLTDKTSERVGEEWATPALKRADLHINHQQPELAAEILRTVTAHDHRAAVLVGHARLALEAGAGADALKLADQARVLAPRSSYAAIIQGAALLAVGRPRDAIAHLTFAADAGRAGAYFLIGLAWTRLENYREAAAAYRKAIAFDADDPGPANNLLPVLSGQHDYRAALEYADSVLARRTGHTSSLAFKCIALGELGRTEELKGLLDQDALIAKEQLQPPPGYPDLAAFNRALGRELAADPSLLYERNTTRFGYQTDDIAFTSAPAIQALNAALAAAVRRRVATVRRTSDHPFDRAVPRDFRLYSWGVIMHEKGHQAPHFHPHGWLSGVYYIDVPDEISESDPARNGWLEFGRGDDRWQRKATAMPTLQLCPKAGLLFTFPSFFWHNTRPLRSNKPRISFAFDVIPL